MTITVVGAGAIGATVGAHLLRAGLQVRLVDSDADHIAAMRQDGLMIQGFDETFAVPVTNAALPDELDDALETVLLAVKSQHTSAALQTVAPLLASDGVVVSMQNGLCEQVIADVVGPHRTIGCLVNFSADYLGPGVISYGGLGSVRVGELDGVLTERVRGLCALLNSWGPVEVTDNIWGYLWAKLGYANMMFATATSDEPAAETISHFRPLMVELAAEVYDVADAEGVRPEPFDGIEPQLYHPPHGRDWQAIDRAFDRMHERNRSNTKTHTGIWRDLAVRRRPTEVDQQIGRVVDIGERYGRDLPLTRRLIGMIHELERGDRERGVANLHELDAVRQDTGGSI